MTHSLTTDTGQPHRHRHRHQKVDVIRNIFCHNINEELTFIVRKTERLNEIRIDSLLGANTSYF